MRTLFSALAAVLVATPAVAGTCSGGGHSHAHAAPAHVEHQTVAHHQEAPAADLVDTAASLSDFSTLVAAVKAADLVDALKGEGPFTVFAPTNDAFAKLPAGTVENLLKPENKEQLTSVLLYHVVPAKVLAKDVVNVDSADTLLEGKKLAVKVVDGKVMINDAQVIKTDVVTANGVIHVVDSVILP